jgi:UDP-N-acetylmuramoyl-L-alanyl-D-glutamate--2,6-diaminopimelate ligase
MCAEFGLNEPEGFDLEAIEVTGVSSDHRSVEAGDVFVAIPGERTHGAEFLDEVVEAGVVAVLTDPLGAERATELDVPVIVIDEPRLALGHVAKWVYRTDPEEPRLFGVAGTIGKTSVSYLVADLFGRIGVASGLSTSIARRVDEQRVIATLTTPEADDLHALVARMREVADRVAAIEISGHALSGQRLAGLEFAVVGPFTFTGSDAEAAEFFELHRQLLDPEVASAGVINVDSQVGRDLVEAARIPVATLSAEPESGADWRVEWRSVDGGTEFTVRGHDDRVVTSRITKPGRLAAVNAAAAIVMIAEGGWATEQIQDALDRTGGFDVPIPGRLERVRAGGDGPEVFVDVDERPEAIRGSLQALSEAGGDAPHLVVHPSGAAAIERFAQLRELTAKKPIVITDAAIDGAPGLRLAADAAAALQRASRDAGRGGRILFVEPRADALRELDEGEVVDPTVALVRDALADAGW